MKLPALDKIHFENPTDTDVKRLQNYIDDNGLTPEDLKYRFSKIYGWRIRIANGKLVLGYAVRYKRPKIEASYVWDNFMIVFESPERFIMQDKNGVMHGIEKDKQDQQSATDVEYRKWLSAKKIADFMGLTYLGDGIFEKVEKSE